MFDLVGLIKTTGYLGLFGIVFAESGLLIGFFLPGDSLLFTAGFLASQGFLDIGWLMAVTFLGAVLGDSFGYAFGRKVGYKIFKREDSFLFHRDHLERAQKFYQTHGGKTIIMARFLPVVRTFAPILAGVGKMRYLTFLFFNIIGGFLWAVGLSWLGYYLGSVIPNIDKYLVPLILFIIIGSMLPSIIHILKNPTHRRQIAEFIRSKLKK
mgnify:FL=1